MNFDNKKNFIIVANCAILMSLLSGCGPPPYARQSTPNVITSVSTNQPTLIAIPSTQPIIKPSPTIAQTPTTTSIPNNKILYEIDFETNGAELWDLGDDWEIITEDTGNHYLLGKGPNDYPQAWYKEDDTPWNDYAFESRVKFVGGTLFMCIRSYPGKSSFFTATFDSDNNWVNVAEFDQSTIGWRNIGEGTRKTIAKNTWYLFRVEIVGDQIKVFINDKLVVEKTASNPIASERGGIGFYMRGGQEIHFDDIRVWELP